MNFNKQKKTTLQCTTHPIITPKRGISLNTNNTTASINLKYIIGDEIPKPFPWQIFILALFAICIFCVSLWLFSQRYTPQYIEHIVVEGETIPSLAEKYYGNKDSIKKIFEANRKKLMNRNKLIPGEKLRIPKIDALQKSISSQ